MVDWAGRGGGGRCTNPTGQDAWATKFYTVAADMCSPSVWNLLLVSLLRLEFGGGSDLWKSMDAVLDRVLITL
jgi:hypothetical protein